MTAFHRRGFDRPPSSHGLHHGCDADFHDHPSCGVERTNDGIVVFRPPQTLGRSPSLSREHGGVRVAGLGAICDLEPIASDDGSAVHFRVGEYLDLEDGTRIVLHNERGFSAGMPWDQFWPHQTVETITNYVMMTVLPDDAELTRDDHAWAWLAALAHAQGVRVSADELRGLNDDVVLTGAVLELINDQS